MRDWSREHAFRDLFFSLPEMRHNEFIAHLYQMNREEEDEGERAPPLEAIFDDEAVMAKPMSDERTNISLALVPARPRFILNRRPEHE
ncbi:hypothetical protein ApAK_08670 [Thermoplasmatales archaeon AK]|nr:hypothetical protein [Thermoplasmatales archaeon AK]